MLPALVAVTALGACGAARHTHAVPQTRGPLTAPALAWLVDEHVTGDASSAEPMAESELGPLGDDAMGVKLRFRPSEGDDGELVQLFMAPWSSRAMREHRTLHSCANVRGTCGEVAGASVVWDTVLPGEDPGSVSVLSRSGPMAVVARYSGPPIGGDPRGLDLPVSVDDLVALVTDPRIGPTTTAEALDEGTQYEVYDDPSTPGRDLPLPD